MANKLLDLSNISDWMAETGRIVPNLVPETILAKLKYFDPEEMYDDTMTYLLDEFDKAEDYKELDDLCLELEDAFLKTYDTIKGFHACRSFTGIDSYKNHGILKMSRNLLRELAHKTFQNQATPEAINKAVDEYKIDRHDESIFLFTDLINPLDKTGNHYLQSGSEILQAISIKLNLHSQGILASQGHPYLIECDVPLKHVSQEFRFGIWKILLTTFLKVSAGDQLSSNPFEYCIQVNEPIPSEAIRNFHLVDEAKIIYMYPRH